VVDSIRQNNKSIIKPVADADADADAEAAAAAAEVDDDGQRSPSLDGLPRGDGVGVVIALLPQSHPNPLPAAGVFVAPSG